MNYAKSVNSVMLFTFLMNGLSLTSSFRPVVHEGMPSWSLYGQSRLSCRGYWQMSLRGHAQFRKDIRRYNSAHIRWLYKR